MNEDQQKREVEEQKFREQIAELTQLEADLPNAQAIYEQIQPEYEKLLAYYKKCEAAKTRLRMLRRDYPGYFPKANAETNN